VPGLNTNFKWTFLWHHQKYQSHPMSHRVQFLDQSFSFFLQVWTAVLLCRRTPAYYGRIVVKTLYTPAPTKSCAAFKNVCIHQCNPVYDLFWYAKVFHFVQQFFVWYLVESLTNIWPIKHMALVTCIISFYFLSNLISISSL
jgi:hypothetical protein